MCLKESNIYLKRLTPSLFQKKNTFVTKANEAGDCDQHQQPDTILTGGNSFQGLVTQLNVSHSKFLSNV